MCMQKTANSVILTNKEQVCLLHTIKSSLKSKWYQWNNMASFHFSPISGLSFCTIPRKSMSFTIPEIFVFRHTTNTLIIHLNVRKRVFFFIGLHLKSSLLVWSIKNETRKLSFNISGKKTHLIMWVCAFWLIHFLAKPVSRQVRWDDLVWLSVIYRTE